MIGVFWLLEGAPLCNSIYVGSDLRLQVPEPRPGFCPASLFVQLTALPSLPFSFRGRCCH